MHYYLSTCTFKYHSATKMSQFSAGGDDGSVGGTSGGSVGGTSGGSVAGRLTSNDIIQNLLNFFGLSSTASLIERLKSMLPELNLNGTHLTNIAALLTITVLILRRATQSADVFDSANLPTNPGQLLHLLITLKKQEVQDETHLARFCAALHTTLPLLMGEIGRWFPDLPATNYDQVGLIHHLTHLIWELHPERRIEPSDFIVPQMAMVLFPRSGQVLRKMQEALCITPGDDITSLVRYMLIRAYSDKARFLKPIGELLEAYGVIVGARMPISDLGIYLQRITAQLIILTDPANAVTLAEMANMHYDLVQAMGPC